MTSIEWLQSKMKIYSLSTAKKLEIVTLFEEAKFLHKQEILAAFCNGDNSDCISEQNSKKFAEQYYKKTRLNNFFRNNKSILGHVEVFISLYEILHMVRTKLYY
jgi:hypothetical protein